jgi:outer membrane protein OmpA-like peptidoglycan-associated protein
MPTGGPTSSVRTSFIAASLAVVMLLGVAGCSSDDRSGEHDGRSSEPAAAQSASVAQPAFKPEPCHVLPSTPSNQEQLASFQSATIPLVAGLTLVEAWESRTGDRESITRIASVGPDGVHIVNSGISQNDRPMTAARTICQDDLLHGGTYITEMGGPNSEILHGATNFSLSRSLFRDVKAGKSPFFEYADGIRMTGPGSYRSHSLPGSLKRVEHDAVPLPVIVNGTRVMLPAIHATGDIADATADVYVMDDERNPVTLRFHIADLKFGVDIVEISYPVEQPRLEQALAETGRVEVYGIYFDFGSAVLKAESDTVLKEIADALEKNPAWTLSVEGHTDNIGGDSYNLDLSQRRAQAVKQALVDRYHTPADRLSPVGYGASRPKEPNDTLAGRARNRRVELVRQ